MWYIIANQIMDIDLICMINKLTLGDVAEASNGNSPPQAIMRLSASWDMRCTVLTTNIAFSLLLTKSNTDFVEWLQINEILNYQLLI